MTEQLKRGTKIEVQGAPAMGGFPAVPPETATIMEHAWTDRISGHWYRVTFDADGGRLCVHDSRFRKMDG